MALEDALDSIYRGRSNVALMARDLAMPTTELKRLFSVYAGRRPADPDIWKADVELGWPWI